MGKILIHTDLGITAERSGGTRVTDLASEKKFVVEVEE